MANRYIITDSSGWLRVRLEPSQRIISLPEYLRVEDLGRRDHRDHFKILEGIHTGTLASVAARGASTSWLGSPLPAYRGPVTLRFKKGADKLQTPIGPLDATTDSRNPIPNGTHPIQLPDYPHDLGRGYLSDASKAMTWFHLGTGIAAPGNDRYLHVGLVSAGCVTVTDRRRWDALYSRLILARAPGGRAVGSLVVES